MRVLVRDPAKSADLVTMGAEIVIGDLYDEKTLAPATEDVVELFKKDLNVSVLRLSFVYGDKDPHICEIVPYLKMMNRYSGSRMHMVHHLDVAESLFR